MNAVRFHIQGRVQGVGYRNFAATQARNLKLVGYVKNMSDGSVECIVQGPASQVEKLSVLLQQGPALGQVGEISRSEIEAKLPDSFEIQY
jgi:acylphosphatase